jgi:phenylacetaldehyde dehydrogenase
VSGRAHYTELVDGSVAEARISGDGVLEDPDDGSVVATRRDSAPEAVGGALATAGSDAARSNWSELSIEARCDALARFATALDGRAEEIARVDSVDSGVPIAVTRVMAGSLGGSVRAAMATALRLGDAKRFEVDERRIELLRLPWGPALILTPWNAPAAAAIGKVANALVAGCPVILKPSEQAPSFSAYFAEAALAAELPAESFQIVHGGAAVARSLVGDPRIRVIALTGGRATGRAVAAAAATRMIPLQLELGGSNPAIVTADADLTATAIALVEGMTKLNGQWCEAPRRVMVPAAMQGDLAEALRAAAAGLVVGPARDAATEFGPLANRSHRERVRNQVGGLGGRTVETVAVPAGEGFFMSPTLVLDADPVRSGEEIFGPVLSLLPYRDESEAVALANAGESGLAAYVFSGDEEHAFALGRRLEAGEVRLGGTKLIDLVGESTQSFWGASGVGGHGAQQVFEAFRGSRIVGDEDCSLPL